MIVKSNNYEWRIIEHEGLRYLLTETEVDRDKCDDCTLAALLLTEARLATWLHEMDLARELNAAHAIEEIVFRDYDASHGPEYYPVADEADPEAEDDDRLPDWVGEARVEIEQRHVRPDTIYWTARHHYADVDISTPWIDRAELEALARYLADDAAATTRAL